MQFEFATANRILFGPGVISQAGFITAHFGTRALIVSGKNPAKSERLATVLSEAGVESTRFVVAGEPSVEAIEKGVEAGRQHGCNVVLAIGGGSSIDAGKAIAAMAANPGGLMDYLEVIGGGKALPNTPLPFLAIPTTAGTGSEVTRNAVLFSPEHRVKVSLRSPGMLPRVAIVDPDLTLDLPPSLTASTGMDALTQVLEPFVCTRANPMTDAICREGMRLAAGSLLQAFHKGADRTAREQMSLASLFGGIALANAGLGAVHGFAGPLGGMFPAPHGAICAALLPIVTEINVRAMQARHPESPTLWRYHEIAQILTGNPVAKAMDGVSWLSAVVNILGIPRLSAYGVTESFIPKIVANARKASSMKPNPVVLTDEELAEIVSRAL